MKLSKSIMQIIFTGLVSGAVSCLLVIVLFEWLVGCGETYVDAYGDRHANECLFINNGEEQ